MRSIRSGKVRRACFFAAAAGLLLAALWRNDATVSTAGALSLKHIEEIISSGGTFDVLEIVPDEQYASIGYYAGGQEPIDGWRKALAGLGSPEARSGYVNGLFSALADKGVLGGTEEFPLKCTYYDAQAGGYYAEAYEVDDVESWSVLHLERSESAPKTGEFVQQEGGPYRANYAYELSPGGGYVQNIAFFVYNPEHTYAPGTRYYSPTFTPLEYGTDLTGWEDVAIYTKDEETGVYSVDPQRVTVGEIIATGGFDAGVKYYYVPPGGTGEPGDYSYAAVSSYADSDDSPGDGFIPAPPGTESYFAREIESFTYVGTGGNYACLEGGSQTYDVYYSDVYYKAGFSNSEIFKREVFGLGDDDLGAIDIEVSVRTPEEVTAADVSFADMIYISSGAGLALSGAPPGFADDIQDPVAVQIYNFAAAQKPVIVDYSLIEGITPSTPQQEISRIEKLCLLLLQPTISPTAEASLDSLDVNWAALSYVSEDADKTFVTGNVYCFAPFCTDSLSGQPDVGAIVTPLFSKPFAPEVAESGFSDVLAEIQNENFLRRISGQAELLDETVSVSAAIRHVINYEGRRLMTPKESIRVLDLEPAKVTQSTWLTPEEVSAWTGGAIPPEKVSVVHMATGEFVGKIEDLCETYDLIYVGMSTESLNTSGGQTAYNDSSMNGLVYTNVGDRFYATIEMAGMRTQDYIQDYVHNGYKPINGLPGTAANLFRFSGNDITKRKADELRQFAAAGYPIVIADGLLSGTGVNSGRVDNSSYMYEALSGVYGAYANVVSESFAASNGAHIVKYLNVSKPSLVLTSKPADYEENSSSALAPDPNDGHYYLSYKFSISNPTDPTPVSTTYDCRLYIDLNADGRYSESERLADVEVRRASDGALVLPVEDGEGHERYALKAGVEYALIRQMPDDYVGIIPWKLEVKKNGADQIHASAQGFARIAAGGGYQTIRVLQIMQAGTSGTKLNLAQQLTVNPSGSNPQLLGKDGKYYTGIYGKLIADLEDFKVTIDAVENDELEAMGDVAAIFSYLDGYDMLIIGFNDCYDGVGAKAAAAIVEYIGTGKSVLFTHDTTSLSQVPFSAYPMATAKLSPTVKTLAPTDVLWNSSTSEYRSIDGSIYWKGGYSTTPPAFVRQTSQSYIVFMSSDVETANEEDYFAARAAVYRFTGSSYTQIYPSSLQALKNTAGSYPIIYVYCAPGSVSGWYSAANQNKYSVSLAGDFTKFSGGLRYYCSGLRYSYSSGHPKPADAVTITGASYPWLARCLYNDSTCDSYAVAGTYDAQSNTYTIGGATWYPEPGAGFPQSTLYSSDPSAPSYTIGTIPSNISDWGYYFNTVIRDFVGLDRYGITNPTLRPVVDKDGSMSQQDIALVLGSKRGVAFAPGSYRTSTVSECQGYTNYALIRFAGSGNAYKYTKNTYSIRETTSVSQVNKGQITTYPYNVNTAAFGGRDPTITGYGGAFMRIGNTHEQYFQINMNTDDIVVWYCLSSGTTADTNYYYDDVPNDCVNAYYIYNKGNVTYSGVGHSSNASLYTGSSIGQEYINEAKLFVNTMIAAYQSGEQAPSVAFKRDARGVSDLRERFIPVDEGRADVTADSSALPEAFGAHDESRAVYFRVYDPNMAVSKTITAEFFVADEGGGTVQGIGEKVSPLLDGGRPVAVFNADGTAAGPLKGGHVYKIYLPDACLERLKDDTVYSVRLYLKVTSTIGASSRFDVDSLELKKLQLFELS